jgi:hypothetical protein
MRCARHPDVETELACGRCGTPICPRCLVQTPVGARCPDCAQVKRVPTFESSPICLASGVAAAGAAGAAAGLIWYLLLPRRLSGYAFVSLFLALGIGYAIGEAVSLATNRKRGPTLQAVAAVGVVVAYIVRNLLEGGGVIPTNDVYGYITVGIGIVIAIGRLR